MSQQYRYLSSGGGGNGAVYEVIERAGPHHLYYGPNHESQILSNVTKYTTEITHHPASYNTVQYRINDDPDPVRIIRSFSAAPQRQNIHVRYLEPPELPEPAPIVIKERQLTPLPPAPPIVIRQIAKPPPTPPPLIIRERPPTAPEMPKPTVIERLIPPPTPPPRQVIVERIPAPEKHRDIIYEKWLPYKEMKDRQVIVERAKVAPKQPAPKNVIIEYENKQRGVDRIVFDDGVIRANPASHSLSRPMSRSNAEIRMVERIGDAYSSAANFNYTPAPSAVQPFRHRQPQQQQHFTPQEQAAINRALTAGQPQQYSKPKQQPFKPTSPRGPTAYLGPFNTTYRSSYGGGNNR